MMIYINMAEKNFNGSICSLLMFQYEIVNGQGLIAKNQIDKPYWYGSTQIGANIEKINELISTLQANCRNDDSPDQFKTNLDHAYNDNKDFIVNFNTSLESIYSDNKDKSINIDNSNQIKIIPLYILNLGPKENSSTLTGKIYEEYMNKYNYMFFDIIAPVKMLCDHIGSSTSGRRILDDDESPLSSGLGEFNTVIGGLNDALDSVASTLTDYITKYKNYIINFIYKVNFYLFAIVIGCIIIEIIFYTIYYFHPFSLIKCNIYFFIHLISFLLILCIIYNSIFGIFSLLMGNVADIIDAILSKENLSSESPKIIGEGDIKKLEKCLRGDGNLFDEFMNEDMKKIIEPLTMLYTKYTPVRTINEKMHPLIATEKNEYNTFIKLEEIIKNLENMKNDFIPTTSEESAGIYNIQSLLDKLTYYTNKDKNSMTCCLTQDNWTTVSNNCPTNGHPGIIDNNNCKTLGKYYPGVDPTDTCTTTTPSSSYASCEALKIKNLYNSGCSSHLQNIENYSKILLQYYIENKKVIDDLVGNTTPIKGLTKINNDFNDKFIAPIKSVIEYIDEKITTKVYETFNEFLNDPSKDTYQLRNSKDFNLFSWMNCSTIGQDYNATLSTLKSSLTKELKIITYVSLLFEFLLIANLYIMVGLSKNLIDKKYEKNEEKNVSIEEIDINGLKETEKGEEIYSIKNNNNKNYSNPVSLSGSDRRNLSQNGEKVNEIMNMKRKNKKIIEDKNSQLTKTD